MIKQQKLSRAKIESVARNIIRAASIITLCYFAWKGVSGSDGHSGFISYITVIALILIISFF